MNKAEYGKKTQIIYFDTAAEAHIYAKANPGLVIKRVKDRFAAFGSYKKNMHSKITPHSILEHLDQYVVSQDLPKREIAQTLYYHYARFKNREASVFGQNLPLMLVGSTGSGKTFIMQKACEAVDLIFLHVNTANMVPDGIKGYSVDSIGSELLKLSDGGMGRLYHAVIFLDEIDKLFLDDNSDSQFGSKVAAQILRILEGGDLKVYKNDSTYTIKTDNMLFILGGAFQSIVDEKFTQKDVMGFVDNNKKEKNIAITLEDLYAYGVPKELLGRVGSVLNLSKLSKDDYLNILTKSKSTPLADFTTKIQYHGNFVDIDMNTLENIAQEAAQSDLGARGLRQILKLLFQDALFDAPSRRGVTYKIRYE
ncbi:MAG: AAA family ATPase [Sulfurimonas sp.]|uniref:AAA family ATPase n=1 Tax=Sulfurimonas sp. TaxID=2022749 RepID=UPI00263650AB|nr:AAA family ATPase [Sulfurimonas sp.]MDD2651640.1 AAA family ATPase [Sulfurimonas sp.]MDD3451451.1 AAA family ATPase [Sulfurimonas sp.]